MEVNVDLIREVLCTPGAVVSPTVRRAAARQLRFALPHLDRLTYLNLNDAQFSTDMPALTASLPSQVHLTELNLAGLCSLCLPALVTLLHESSDAMTLF